MLRIGLTGGIGSGKTAAANYFEQLGVPVIDSDNITRELVTPGSPALQQIVNRFGKEFVDANGNLNRRLLRQSIFANDLARRDLEKILHPMVRQEIKKQLSRLSSPYVLVVVPLMVESDMVTMFDRVIVVDCSEEEQIKRVTKRDSCTKDEVAAILNTQTSRNKRLEIATDIIKNVSNILSLERQVIQLHHRFLNLAKHQRH